MALDLGLKKAFPYQTSRGTLWEIRLLGQQAGGVKVSEGPGGGYGLARAPEDPFEGAKPHE